jgi:unsaturated rhamnogalacturonyl hydrolase
MNLEKCVPAVADRLLEFPWKVWFWGDSIGIEGLLSATRLTGDSRYTYYVYGLLKAWCARQDDFRKFDHTAPGYALVDLIEETGDPALLEAAKRFKEQLDGYRRLPNGCPVHYEDAHLELPPELPKDHPRFDPELEAVRLANRTRDGGPCVFVDSVHFQAPFLSRLGKLLKDSVIQEEAVRTLRGQVELVWDPEACLFNHFWIEDQQRPNGVHWGRGQGWGMLGIIETLKHLPEGHAAFDYFLPILEAQAAALQEFQDKSGDWHTIINDKSAYLETSVAAFVVQGFSESMMHGWIEKSYIGVVESAMKAMLSHVDGGGLFAGVSFETFPSTNPAHYKTMPVDAMVPWGQGPFLTACEAYLNLVNS